MRFFGRAPDDWQQVVPFSEAEEYADDIDRLVNAAVHQAEAAFRVSALDSLFQAIARSARWGRVSLGPRSTAAELRRYVEESTVAPSDYLLESIAALTPGYLLARGLPDPVVSNAGPVQPHDGNVAPARHRLAQQINAGDLQLLINLRQMLEQRHTRPGIIRLADLIIQKVHSGRAVPSVIELLAAAVREPVLRATPPGWYVPVVAADALNLNLTILQPGQPPWQLRPGLPPLYLEYDGNQYSPAGPPTIPGSNARSSPRRCPPPCGVCRVRDQWLRDSPEAVRRQMPIMSAVTNTRSFRRLTPIRRGAPQSVPTGTEPNRASLVVNPARCQATWSTSPRNSLRDVPGCKRRHVPPKSQPLKRHPSDNRRSYLP